MIEPHLWFNWLKIFFFAVSAENHRWTSKGKISNYLLNWYLSKQKLFQETRLNQFLQYIGNNQKNEEELVRILWSYQSHIFIILYERCMICHHIQFGCHIWYLSLLILWEEEWPYRVILVILGTCSFLALWEEEWPYRVILGHTRMIIRSSEMSNLVHMSFSSLRRP